MQAQITNTLWNALDNASGDNVQILCPPFDNAAKHGLSFVKGIFTIGSTEYGLLTVSYEGDAEWFELDRAADGQSVHLTEYPSHKYVATKAIEAAAGMLEINGLTLEDVC